MDIPEISYEESFGLPRPDWDGFRRLVEALPGDVDLNATWTEAARRWLLELGHARAAWEDAGDAASRAVYGCGVDEWARQFLGEGDWKPRPIPEGEAPRPPAATRHAG